MAISFNPGGQSPTSLYRTLEKVFEDAQQTGEINLSSRNLKEYPAIASTYDLSDSNSADLCKNRLSEIPTEVCELPSLERLNCYHNVIRAIPVAITQLQALVHLNLSRNQLSHVPPSVCQLKQLEVLLASNNRLVSLPEEINRLEHLMDLDVSSNEISHLPPQLCELDMLNSLNLRKNLLVELPSELSRLRKLRKLDVSSNRISHLPWDVRHMDTLDEMSLQHNPLVSPPAHVCTKGRVHVMKFLTTEALREERKHNVMSEVELRKGYRKSASIQPSLSDEFRSYGEGTEWRKRHTVDSGYSTTDSLDKSRWSPSEAELPGNKPVSPGISVFSQPNQTAPWPTSPGQTTSPPANWNPGDQARDGDSGRFSVRGSASDRLVAGLREPRQDRDRQNRSIAGIREPRQDKALEQRQSERKLNKVTEDVEKVTRRSDGTGRSGRQNVQQAERLKHIQTKDISPGTKDVKSSRRRQVTTGSRSTSESEASPLAAEQTESRIVSPCWPDDSSPVQTASSPAFPARQGEAGVFTTPDVETSSPRSSLSASSPSTPQLRRSPQDAFSGYQVDSSDGLVDEFTRELQRQKAAYEARKQHAGRLKQQQQEEEQEREERRRAALKLQEDQRAIREKQRDERQQEEKRSDVSRMVRRPRRLTVDNAWISVNQSMTGSMLGSVSSRDSGVSSSPSTGSLISRTDVPVDNRQMNQSHSFSDKNRNVNNNNYRRTVSETSCRVNGSSDAGFHGERNQPERSDLRSPNQANINSHPVTNEFRQKHEALKTQQRYEATLVRKRLEDGKNIKDVQRDAVYTYYSKTKEEEPCTVPNVPLNGASNTGPAFSDRCKAALDAMSNELNTMNPAFTIRRHFLHAEEEAVILQQLRQTIESRLRVTLPENLPGALRDGVVLCHLANHIRPRSVSSIHVPSPAVPKLTPAKCRRNVENFLEACRRMGIDQANMFSAAAVLEERDTVRLAQTVQAFMELAGHSTQQSAV